MKKIKNKDPNNTIEIFLAENLLNLLKYHEISAGELAKDLNIPYNTINRILSGVTTDPRISTLQQIADYFDVSVDFILYKDSMRSMEKNQQITIPIFSWNQIIDPQFLAKFDRTSWNKWITVTSPAHYSNLSNLFALESTKSMQQRYPFGTNFIIDVKEKSIDGDLVLVKFIDNETISLRELVIDSPEWRLLPVISGSASLVFNQENHLIIGVVILTIIQTRFS